jgi:WD40 repeat protein
MLGCVHWRVDIQDVVRSVAFHEEEPVLVSAGDDCTVKIWNWRTAGTVGFGKYEEAYSLSP